MDATIGGLFIGDAAPLSVEGKLSGIVKHRVERVRVTTTGIENDRQVDTRVHGGPEKAVHHYAADNYSRLAARFPDLTAALMPGSIGENISTRGWDERQVHVGDVFAIGSVRVQVSQPRSPCWKIDARYGVEGLTRFIAENGIAGWYYRVLVPGTIAAGDAISLAARDEGSVSIATFWSIVMRDRPAVDDLERLARIEGLNDGWKMRLEQRRARLEGD